MLNDMHAQKRARGNQNPQFSNSEKTQKKQKSDFFDFRKKKELEKKVNPGNLVPYQISFFLNFFKARVYVLFSAPTTRYAMYEDSIHCL